jgi:hypothetical protein
MRLERRTGVVVREWSSSSSLSLLLSSRSLLRPFSLAFVALWGLGLETEEEEEEGRVEGDGEDEREGEDERKGEDERDGGGEALKTPSAKS